jgi:hypothetical protein
MLWDFKMFAVGGIWGCSSCWFVEESSLEILSDLYTNTPFLPVRTGKKPKLKNCSKITKNINVNDIGLDC